MARGAWPHPLFGVAAVVLAAAVGFGVLSTYVLAPRVFGDEVIYLDAGDSLADGHGLKVQDHDYGRGPGYPATIAAIASITQNRSAVYFWAKIANALWFALASVPIYLLARRVLPDCWSVGVCAICALMPSSIYVGLVMTDTLAYLVALLALLAMVVAVERPTLMRQLATATAIPVAYLVRPQFVALVPAYLVALVVVQRHRLRELWPTAALAAGVAVAAALAFARHGGTMLGAYSSVWRSYDVFGVAKMVDYHVAELALYLGLVPLVVLPAAFCSLYGAGPRQRSFLAVAVAATTCAIVTAAAFASSPFSDGRLYDRYFFYVVPLLLIVLAAWLRDGARRSWRTVLPGAALLVAGLATLPVSKYVVSDSSKQLHATGTAVWSRLDDWAVVLGQDGHRVVIVAALVGAAAAFALPRRQTWVLLAPLVVVFAMNSALLWTHGIRDNNGDVFGTQTDATRDWVDAIVPRGQAVALLQVTATCSRSLAYDYLLTGFFNDRVDAMPQIGGEPYGGLPNELAHVRKTGRVADHNGQLLAADWVVAPRGVRLQGRPVAMGAEDHLVLWHVGTPRVRLRASSDRQVEADACSGEA